MESLVNAMLSNALVATVLALAPLVLSRFGRSPALVHSLWLVVLLKLVTPPLVQVPLAISSTAPQVRPPGAVDVASRLTLRPADRQECPPTWSRTTVSPLSGSGMEPRKALSPRSRPETRNWVDGRWLALRCRSRPDRMASWAGLHARTTLPRSPCQSSALGGLSRRCPRRRAGLLVLAAVRIVGQVPAAGHSSRTGRLAGERTRWRMN